MISLDLLGAAIAVDVSDSDLARDISRLWAPFVTDHLHNPAARIRQVTIESAGSACRLLADGGVVATADRYDILIEFATLANRIALDAYAGFAAHAAVVMIDGAAVALPASSGVGKSTLTAACIHRGMTYVSDEALCLSYDDRRVTPYPRPLGLSGWSAQAVGVTRTDGRAEVLVTAADLGGHSTTDRLGLDHVVLLRRDGTPEPGLTRLHRADAMETLLRLSFNHYRRPADAFSLVGAMLPNVSTWELHYGDANLAADVLAARLDNS